MTSHDNRKSGPRGEPAGGRFCPSCGLSATAQARFCHACGAALEAEPARGKWSIAGWIGLGAAVSAIAAALAAVVVMSEREPAPPASAVSTLPLPDLPPQAAPGGLPDLSQITPREAADRLFNRVMAASEQGRNAEALQFVPMAIEAYDSLATLDRDAHYHLGLINLVAGDQAGLDREIAALREGAPDHLLALVLEHEAAQEAGDSAAQARALAALAAAHDAEIAIARPEYEAHRNTIDRIRASAPSAPTAAAPAAGAASGARLFAGNCAGCHGPGAAGSDKGPALVDDVYRPGHHDDDAFRRAIERGVSPHHWSFGAMPPLAGISDDGIGQIIAYVRERQRAAGIR